jgi:hypothetical protein
VVSISERICRAVTCKDSWPLVKQWMKSDIFSSARV